MRTPRTRHPLLAALLALAAAAPAQPRTVTLESLEETVDIACQTRFTTVIVLPASERILDFVTGDSAGWVVGGAANLAYIKPVADEARTNVALITASGKIFSFRVTESGTADPDLTVYVEYEDPEHAARGAASEAEPFPEPAYVAREEVEAFQAAAADAAASARAAWSQAEQEIDNAVAAHQATYPAKLRFEYVLEERAAADPFEVTAMWHDGQFTYARSTAPEAPEIFELRDGKPATVHYDLSADGLYIVSKVLGDGWFQAGKRRARWRRLAPSKLTTFAAAEAADPRVNPPKRHGSQRAEPEQDPPPPGTSPAPEAVRPPPPRRPQAPQVPRLPAPGAR